MAQQTGSISFEATSAASLRADGQYESLSDNLRDNYYTKSEFTVAPDKILSTVKEQSEQSARPNLTPWFSHPMSDVWDATTNPNGYWSNSAATWSGAWTNLKDGWAHIDVDNSAGSSTVGRYSSGDCNLGWMEVGKQYTILLEGRNCTGEVANIYASTGAGDTWLPGSANLKPQFAEGSFTYWQTLTAKAPSGTDVEYRICNFRIQVAAGKTASGDFRFSIYEGEYSGPYKPYVDQSLIGRMSSAETSIEQNAEAITLRAQEIERGMTFVPTKHDREDAWFWYSLPATVWTFLDDGWAHYEYTNAGTSEVSTYIAPKSWGQVIPGEEYTFLIEIKNYSGFSGTGQFMYMQEMAGAQFWGTQVVKANGNVKSTRISYDDIVDGAFTKRFVKLADVDHIGDGTTYDNMCFRYRMYIKPSTTLSIDVRISVYPGDYAGPYNEYLTAASSAQLKVANDAITSKVSTTDYNGQTVASLINQSADTVKIQAQHVEIDGTTTFTSGTTLADYVEGKAQDAADSVVVGGRNLLRRTATPFDWAINVTTYSTHHLYSTGSTDTAYDGPTLEELGLGVGDEVTFTFDWETSQNGSTAIRYGSFRIEYYGVTSSGTNGYITRMGDVVTMNESNASGHFVRTATLTAALLKTQRMVVRVDNSALVFSVSNAKLEKGNKATDWSPAPEDQTAYVDESVKGISIGGRNYLRWSGEGAVYADHLHKDRKWGMANTYCPVTVDGNTFNGVRNSSALTNRTGGLRLSCVTDSGAWAYSNPGDSTDFGIDMAVGDTFTYSVDAKTSGNRIALIPQYYNGSSVWTETGSVEFTPPDDGWHRYECTFTLPANFVCFTALVVACEMVADTTVSAKNYKLERGNKATGWSPSPDDVEQSAVKRTQRIWWRATESGAPSKLETWLDTSGTGYGNWSLSVPQLKSGDTKYPFLYTAVQTQTVAQQAAGNTCSCSPVLIDETTTVIDGGTIITGSVHANSLDADSVKANIVQTTDLSATKITSGDIATERMSANVVKAVKAKVSDLYALVAKIGGFVINATSIFSGTAVTSNADNSIALSTEDFTRTINSTSRAGLRFAIGDKFGVTGDGTLYANGANITSINAGNISSGSISADRIKANVISAVNNGTGTINADKVNVSQITIGESQVTNLTTDLDNKANSSDLTAETSKRKATYGTCSTAAGTADKVVTCANFELYAGAAVTVTFSTANTAVVPKLNVNSTGAVAVWYNNAAASNDNPVLWGANATLTFVYDGSHWVLDEKPPTYAVACSTAAATRDKAATVTGALVVNGTTVAVSFSTANTYVAASLGFNLSGTGDDVIRVDGAVTSASNTFTWAANTTLTLVRRGLCWDVTGNDQASKTATTYLTEGTSNGLMVHRSNNATTGVKITDDVDIVRNGSVMTKVDENGMTLYDGSGTADGNVVAKFSEDLVELGKGSEDAIIKLCDGTGQISLNRLTSDTAWLELMSIYWLKLKGVDSSIELGDEFIYEQGGQSYYAGNVHIESRYNQGERVAEIWMNAEGRDGQTSSIDMYADSINLNGTLTLSTPLADSNLPTMGSADMAGTSDATSGATLAVPYITTDAYGRVTAKGTHTHTIGSLAAGAVTSGTFNAARIPNLNASKITAGTLNSARLPTVPVNKGGTGQTGVTTVTDVASFIAAASGVTINSVRVTVWGKLVHAYVTAKPDAAKTSAWVVGTVVDAYRPNAVVTGKPYYTGVDSARIMTDGTMQITACGAHEVGVSFTYLLA